MYRPYGLQDRDTLLETLIMDDVMTFFPEFNLLVVSSSYDPSEGLYNRTTAIFNARTSEIASGEFFKGCDFVSDMVFEGGQNKAFAIFDTFERDADGGYSYDPSLLPDSEELLEKITSGETVSYFPEFNLLITTVDYDPYERYDRMSAAFNVFPSELAYGELFHGFENVVDIPYSGPVIDPIGFCGTFSGDKGESRVADVSLAGLAELLTGRDVISTQSVPELLDTMADRFGLEPEERVRIAKRAQAKEHARTQGPDIEVDIDSYNDDDFITGTVTVDGESCYFYCPNSNRNPSEYDSVILKPFRPVGFEGDIEDVDLPAAIEENREIVELIVSMEAAPYMDPNKLPVSEQSLDSLCEDKTDEAQSMPSILGIASDLDIDGSHHGLAHQPTRPEHQYARQPDRRRTHRDGLQRQRRSLLPP